ncbi:ABC transporter ATP-binding protein [Tumebacillus sp. ITR2]|uniref:ABC transporter ATP-binding protein n=1 Tax=Tumebacillus amylolyticus TaxID=2801339 RepID=A0ABS1J9K2_9BACL|nr:ABC transporter ATP-binding protein [Tumebacillus amylolyticus]
MKKSYQKIQAVRGISLQVHEGEIFALIGANGAGKTTTMEMIMGLIEPDEGTIHVCGVDARKQPAELKQRIGVALQRTSLYDKIKVKEALKLFASYYERTRDVNEIIEELGLRPHLNQMVKKLSGGWQQRTSLALALLNDPQIIFLDEPTTGLDPQARFELWNIIKRLRAEGKTILLSTHYMEEVQRYCDRCAIIREGLLVACDTPENLIKLLPDDNGSMDDVYVQIAAGRGNGE